MRFVFYFVLMVFISNNMYSQCDINVQIIGHPDIQSDVDSWTLKNATGTTVLSGSGDFFDYWDNETHTEADAPYVFEITTGVNNVEVDYEIYLDGTLTYTDRLSGVQSVTISNISNPYTWTGTTNSDWNTATNWSCGSVPGSSTTVIIPDGCSNYPETFSGGTNPVCASLTIEDGADSPHLTLASGINLDCGGNITIEGTLTVASDASINCGGNWDASSGSFFSNQCTVTFDGTTILNSGGSFPGRDFYNIVIAGDVTLSLNPILAQNDITLSSGTLDVSAGNEDVFIGGDWNNAGGSFNPRAGQVMFNGTGTQHVNTTDGGTTVNTSNFTFYDVRIYGTDVRFHVKESDYKTISINDVQIDADKTLMIVKY